MSNPPWRKRLQSELRRQGLPSEYIARLVQELSDHATDITLENSSMDAEQLADDRLGSPQQLALFARSEYRRSTFAGRHPLVTFVAGPIVTMIGSLALVFLVPFCLLWSIDVVLGMATGSRLSANEMELPFSPFEVGLMQCFNAAVRFVPFVLSAVLFVRLGRRAELRRWSVLACGIIALTAICFSSVFTPAAPGSPGTLMFGLAGKFGLDQILQAAVPLALAAWLIRQNFSNRTHTVVMEATH